MGGAAAGPLAVFNCANGAAESGDDEMKQWVVSTPLSPVHGTAFMRTRWRFDKAARIWQRGRQFNTLDVLSSQIFYHISAAAASARHYCTVEEAEEYVRIAIHSVTR